LPTTATHSSSGTQFAIIGVEHILYNPKNNRWFSGYVEILLLAPTNEPKASSTSKKRSKSSQQQQQKTREEENKEIPQQPYQGSWTNKASKSVR